MKHKLLFVSGLLALVVGLAGLLGTTVVTQGRANSAGPAVSADAPYDLRFLDEMIMHHQGAVMSSKMMIADSDRPEMRKLAQSITESQTEQIERMREWRARWYPGAPATEGTHGMMGEGMMGRTGGMGGMMRGDADEMFLRMMIPHHRSAVDMATEALTQAEHQEIKDLSRTIIREQTAEIKLMEGYLKAWYGDTGTR